MIVSKDSQERLVAIARAGIDELERRLAQVPGVSDCFEAVAELNDTALKNLAKIVEQELEVRGL